MGRKRRGTHTGRRTAKKRAVSRCSAGGLDEDRVALPARLTPAFSAVDEEDEEEKENWRDAKRKKTKKKKKGQRLSVALEEARLRLHVSHLQAGGDCGKPLTCRVEEFNDIFRFVSQRLSSEGEEGG